MEKKMGRPSQGKGWKSFSLDQEIIEYLNNLPDGERSKFVNDLLARGIAEIKNNLELQKENSRGKSH